MNRIDDSQIPEIVRLYNEAFCNCEPYWETDAEASVLSELRKIKDDSCLKFLVTHNDNEFAGLLITNSSDDDIYILELMVDKCYRGQGIGRSLVESALRIAFAREKAGVRLRTDLRNTAAIKLYQKLGFSLFKEADTENPFDVYLRKSLGAEKQVKERPIAIIDGSKLLEIFPLEEYLFFANEAEIQGWKEATGDTSAVPMPLSCLGGKWVAGCQEGKRKLAWVVPRNLK